MKKGYWILGLIAATAITLFGTQAFLSQLRGMAPGTIHVTKPDGTFAEAIANQISFDFSGPMPVLTITPTTAGASGMLDCTDFGPGVCDFVVPALAKQAIDWKGAQTFEQFQTLKAIPPPSDSPNPGFARVYYGLDNKLHLQDATGLDRTFP
jgi:hypothetical protein